MTTTLTTTTTTTRKNLLAVRMKDAVINEVENGSTKATQQYEKARFWHLVSQRDLGKQQP